MDEDGNPIVAESTSYGTKYTIWCERNDVNSNSNEPAWNIKVKWHTRSTSNLELPKGQIQYLANMYRLFTDEKKQIVCSTEYSRAVGDTKYVFRVHPNYKSKGAWYDWMVLNYLRG